MKKSAAEAAPAFRNPNAGPSASQATVDILQTVSRQFWLLAACAALGMFLSVLYWAFAQDWFESKAKMLVTVKDPGLSTNETSKKSWGEESIQDDVLDNHIEIVASRNLIDSALKRGELSTLPSILEFTSPNYDPVDYVRDHLLITKGGEGIARDARTLNIAFRHINPDEARDILQALVIEYEAFLDDQVSHVMGAANDLIQEARIKVEEDLTNSERRYVEMRRSAPVLFQGQGSSNVFLEAFRRFQTELVDIEIRRSDISTRLQKVNDALATVKEGDDLKDMLPLIDSDSLQRLGAFATLQANAAQSAEFLASQPIRTLEAQAKTQGLLDLKSRKQELEVSFGPGHPEVAMLEGRIKLLEQMLSDTAQETAISTVFGQLTPEVLLRSYVNFLNYDLAAMDDKRSQIMKSSQVAEQESKRLLEVELEDRMLNSEIERKQELYDGIVEQLRTLDTATGLSGYMHEVLESPRVGKPVWPKLPLCLLGGIFLGLTGGMALALLNDQIDARFRSPNEITAATGVPVIGHIGHIRKSRGRHGAERLVVDAQAPEAESFRLLRTYLLRDVKAGNFKRMAVTSCQTKDGKSTIVANMAVMFADAGVRTLIIDADMRAPTIHRFFDVPLQNGFADVLQKKIDLADAIQPMSIEGLSLITAGTAVRNPAELLQSEVYDEIMAALETQFDLIIVDSGPVLLVSDPTIVAQKAQATFLVVRSSTDTRRQVQEAVRRLETADVEINGCIINTYGSGKEFSGEYGYNSPYHYYYSGYIRRMETAPEAVSPASHAKNGAHKNGNGHSGPDELP